MSQIEQSKALLEEYETYKLDKALREQIHRKSQSDNTIFFSKMITGTYTFVSSQHEAFREALSSQRSHLLAKSLGTWNNTVFSQIGR